MESVKEEDKTKVNGLKLAFTGLNLFLKTLGQPSKYWFSSKEGRYIRVQGISPNKTTSKMPLINFQENKAKKALKLMKLSRHVNATREDTQKKKSLNKI